MAVAEKTKTQTEAPREATSKGELAVLKPARLPWHPAIGDRFGIDKSGWRTLTDAIYPSAKTTDAVILALSYCKARKLDPFKHPVHIVPIYDKEQGKYVESVWPGIAEHRTTAFRTGQYAGADAADFGPTITKTFEGETKQGRQKIEVRFPEWCQMTLYRLVGNTRVPMPGPRVYWLESYSRIGRTDLPNEMWQKRPSGQLEKCAEAAALRKAFPEELAGMLTADEVGEAEQMTDVTPPKPTRESMKVVEAQPQDADPGSDSAEEEGFALLNNDGEILWAGGDSQEFVRRLCAEMEAVHKTPEMLAGLWETHEEQIKRCPEAIAKVATDKRATLTGKLV